MTVRLDRGVATCRTMTEGPTVVGREAPSGTDEIEEISDLSPKTSGISSPLVARGRRGDLEDYLAQGEACRWCRQPAPCYALGLSPMRQPAPTPCWDFCWDGFRPRHPAGVLASQIWPLNRYDIGLFGFQRGAPAR